MVHHNDIMLPAKTKTRKSKSLKSDWKQFFVNGAKVSADVLISTHPELGLLIQSLGRNEEICIEIKTNGVETVTITSAWSAPGSAIQLDLFPQSA